MPRTRATGAGALFSIGFGLAVLPLKTFENHEGMVKLSIRMDKTSANYIYKNGLAIIPRKGGVSPVPRRQSHVPAYANILAG